MTTYEQALKNLNKVETLKELTETVLGNAVIERMAEITGNKDLAPRIKETILKNPKGELCAEFVNVVRKVVKAGN
jgi:hypothetical protein